MIVFSNPPYDTQKNRHKISALADIDVHEFVDIGARQYSVEDKFCMV